MANFIGKILGKKEPIRIGNLTSITGEFAYYAEWERRGIELALEEINGKGGINGQPVQIVREDDQSDPVRSVEAINKLIREDKIQAIIGPISSDAVISDAPFVEKNKVVLMSAIAGAEGTSSGGGYIFKIFPNTDEEGKSLVMAASRRGNKTAAIIYINTAYGLGLTKTIRREAVGAGIEIVAVEGYKKGTADFSGQLGRIKKQNPNTVFLLGYSNEMGHILKQAREMGLATDFFAPNSFEGPAIRAIAGSAAEGIVYVMPFDKFSKEFSENFRKKYGHDPDFVDALNYDAVNLLALAIERGGYSGQAIKNELFKLKDYPGASGSITFDETGQAINRPLTLRVVKDGESVPYKQ